jgi:Mg/Co/Ni transporter MgtE
MGAMPPREKLIGILIGAVIAGLVGAVITVLAKDWVERWRMLPPLQRFAWGFGVLGAGGAAYLATPLPNLDRFSVEWFFVVAVFSFVGLVLGCTLAVAVSFVTWAWRNGNKAS